MNSLERLTAHQDAKPLNESRKWRWALTYMGGVLLLLLVFVLLCKVLGITGESLLTFFMYYASIFGTGWSLACGIGVGGQAARDYVARKNPPTTDYSTGTEGP